MLVPRASASFHSEVVVIGAGVVGLAVTRALAQAGREVVLLEKSSHICTETSSRNSEVIHAVRLVNYVFWFFLFWKKRCQRHR
jgi:L-2-hydroxyglutarate oxidase LhgO